MNKIMRVKPTYRVWYIKKDSIMMVNFGGASLSPLKVGAVSFL